MEEILNLIKEYIIDSKSSYDSFYNKYNDSSLNKTLEEIEKLIKNA